MRVCPIHVFSRDRERGASCFREGAERYTDVIFLTGNGSKARMYGQEDFNGGSGEQIGKR